MKTINISPLQWEWLYWLTGTPQFEEDCPEWDQDFIKRLRECDFAWNAIDRLTGKKKPGVPLTFSFPQDLEVISFLHEELERLKDMQSDDITGYYEENDKRVYGNIRSINNLKKENYSMNNIQCEFCEHEFNEDLVKYGCPNCHGEGLDEGIDTNGQISNES